MQSAPLLLPRRRRLLPVALVVLLHWIVVAVLLDVNLHLTLPARATAEAGGTLLAELLPAEAPPAPPPPPPAPLPVAEASLPPLPTIPPVPVTLGMPDLPGDITLGRAQPEPAAGPAGDAPAAPAAAPPPTEVPAPVPETPPAPPPPAPPLAAPAPRHYAVDMPPPAKITLDVARVDADGTRWSGEAVLAWQADADRYRIQVEAGIRVVFARVNLVVLNSEGAVAPTGFAPTKMTEKRRGRSLTATHFDWDGNRLTFSSSQAVYPLVPGAQDKASIPLQLSAIARGDPKQLSGDIDIFVGEDRDATVYRFQVVGQEIIDTPMGKLQTWHLTRPPLPGSYKSRLDIWLAPQHGWYPVQIRNTEAKGAVTTQTVNNIVLNHSGS